MLRYNIIPYNRVFWLEPCVGYGCLIWFAVYAWRVSHSFSFIIYKADCILMILFELLIKLKKPLSLDNETVSALMYVRLN